MNDTLQLEEALALALRLAPDDRLRLVERVVVSVQRDMAGHTPVNQAPAENHWGQAVNQLLDTLDLHEWAALDLNDPVAWVQQQRAAQAARHHSSWDDVA